MTDVFEIYRDRLINGLEFGIFADCAAAASTSDAPVDAFADLEALLQQTAAALHQAYEGDERSGAISQAISSYVGEVWPHRESAGLDKGGAEGLAERYEVLGILPARITAAFGRNWVEGGSKNNSNVIPLPPGAHQRNGNAEGTGAKSDENANEKGHGQAPKGHAGEGEHTFAAPAWKPRLVPIRNDATSISFEDICAEARAAASKQHCVIALLGMTTAGKTFFVRRLADATLGYGVTDFQGRPINTGEITERTAGVVGYRLETNRKRKRTFIIFDMPGEYFEAFAENRADGAKEESRLNISAILSAADVCIVIEPALQVLRADIYRTDGDCTTEGLVGDYLAAPERMPREQIEAGVTLEQWAEQSAFDERAGIVRTLQGYPNLMTPIRRRILHLRREVRNMFAASTAEEIKAKISEFVDMPYDECPDTNAPLPMPGLLLLSRTDDFMARAGISPDDPILRDPTLALKAFDQNKFELYSRTFSIFGVDFISANVPPANFAGNRKEYQRDWAHYGVAGLIDDWILPAIRACGRPVMQRDNAYRLRSLLDHDFRLENPT